MFKDKIALVTGARRGIGLATARLLAQAGATLVLVNRPDEQGGEAPLAALAAELGPDHLALAADISDSAQVAALYRAVHKRFGRLDVLVNNAGILGDARLGMISDDLIQRVMATNLVSVITNIQAASKLMRRGGGGAIVSVTSIIGLRGNAGQVVYGASKAGIVGATLSAAKELAADHIRVNAVAPGFIETDMIAHLPDSVTRERLASIALGRAGTAEEVAEAIVFLASDKARYITGQVLGVDGGMVL
jgi:3-oxoacyl-[acyl-carrier protein] reductase